MTKKKPTAKDVFQMLHDFNCVFLGDKGLQAAYNKMMDDAGYSKHEITPEQQRLSITFTSAFEIASLSCKITDKARADIAAVKVNSDTHINLSA